MDVQRMRVNDDEFAVISMEVNHAGYLSKLTSAEREVAERMLCGQSNSEIARARGTAVRTVVNQVASVYEKFRVNSRAEFIALYQDSLGHDPG